MSDPLAIWKPLTVIRNVKRDKVVSTTRGEQLCIIEHWTDGTTTEHLVTPMGGRFICPMVQCDHHYNWAVNLVKHVKRDHEKEVLADRQSGPSVGDVSMATPVDIEDLLQRIGCAYDSVYHLVICERCETAVDPNALPNHVQGHGLTMTNHEYKRLLAERTVLDRKAFFNQHHGPMLAVSRVPVVWQGFWCGMHGCDTARGTLESFKKHCNVDHPHTNAMELMETGPVQSVFGSSAAYIRVQAVIPEDDQLQRTLCFMQSIPKQVVQDLSDTPDAGLSSFLRQTRWNEYFIQLKEKNGLGLSQYYKLARIDEKNMTEEEKNLRDIVRDFCEGLTTQVRRTDPFLKKVINTKE